MSLQWTDLPSDLSYLKDAAEKYGRYNSFLDPYVSLIERLNADELKELVQLYKEIERQQHAARISAWSEAAQKQRNHAGTAIFDLFLIFDLLADRNISPFDSRSVEYSPPLPKFDWNKLPERLSYLVQPAEEFGVYTFEDEIKRFIQNVSPEQRKKLKLLEERILAAGDYDKIYEWIEETFSQWPERTFVAALLRVMKEMGLFAKSEPSPQALERVQYEVLEELKAEGLIGNKTNPKEIERRIMENLRALGEI